MFCLEAMCVHTCNLQEEDAASPYVGTEEVDVSDGPKDLQHYLVVYVNKELGLEPPLPSRGKALYDTCSDPTVLWLVEADTTNVLQFTNSAAAAS